MIRPDRPAPVGSWWGWGDPALVPELPEPVLALLRDGLGVRGPGPAVPALDALRPPPVRLTPDVLDRLRAVVGHEHVLDDAQARIRHTRGKSTPDLLRLRQGELAGAPDAVILPGSHDEVLALLGRCSEARVAVLPFGGGSSVVGGLEPELDGFAGLIALDLGRMDAIRALDEESRVAVLEPGLRGPQAEALLGARGYTLGHFPQSFEYASIGGFAAARSSGQASAGYGRFDDLVLALEVATPAGSLALGRAPKTATGPDLRQLVLGSEGAFGVITAVTARLRPVPETCIYDGWRLPSFAAGCAVARALIQDGPRPTVLRVSDEAETAVGLARPDELATGSGGGCLAIVGFEGRREEVRARREAASAVVGAAGGTVDAEAGSGWARERFRGPYLRDALLSAGALVETLETVTTWSSLGRLHRAVSDALTNALGAQGTPPVVLCHVSHVYPAGASLYFTVACAQAEDPVAQWRAAKASASAAILAGGGSISHHHGIGRDHRDGLAEEIGTLGVNVLQAIKRTLDPAGILNPGILVPPQAP